VAIGRAFKISTIIIIILLAVSAVVYLLDILGLYSVSGMMKKVPVVGRLADKEEAMDGKSTADIIEEAVAEAKKNAKLEIARYQKKISEIDRQLAVISKEKKLLEAKNQSLQTKVDELQAWKNEQQQVVKADYPKLAQYYAGMKPAAAAKIMENLSAEMNVGILQNMEDDQVAKILSAMPPEKAAGLVEQMNGQQVTVNTTR